MYLKPTNVLPIKPVLVNHGYFPCRLLACFTVFITQVGMAVEASEYYLFVRLR